MSRTLVPAASSKNVLIEHVRAQVPGFRQRAGEAEQARELPAASIEAFHVAGLARTLVPRRFGGRELGLDALFELVVEIGRGDASHAWCAGLMISHPHMVAFFPERAQQEVWADGPDVPIALSVPPVCAVRQVAGGFRVSGRSPFVSGILHSRWVIVSGMVHGDRAPQWCFFLVPKDEYAVEYTWFTSAMQATGSNTVVTDDVFVPEHRMLRLSDFREGRGPGSAAHAAPQYHLPWASYAPTTFVATMIGAVRGAYEQFRDWTTARVTASGAPVAELASVQLRMSEIGADLDAAELLVGRALDQTALPIPPSLQTRARSMRDFSRAGQLAVSSIDALLAMSGTAGFAESNALQRAWRDIHFAAAHVSVNPEVNAVHWARLELGVERPPSVQIY